MVIPNKQILKDLNTYKRNPAGIQRVIFDIVDNSIPGGVVDPTNPFVFLLEASCLNTATAINENIINLRKQYPSLAQNEEDLYLHMSDEDYINRFAIPSETTFTVIINYEDLLNNYQGVGAYTLQAGKKIYNEHKVTFPRNTKFIVDNTTFSIQYPINITIYSDQSIQVTYDYSNLSPLQTLTTNIIDYVIRNEVNGVKWLSFELPVKQFTISSSNLVIQNSSYFKQIIPYNDKFYYCRIWHKFNNSWEEILVTYTDQVYDPEKVTASVQVHSLNIIVHIPNIYISSKLISPNIRVDIYTTLGKQVINMADYKISAFETELSAIDETELDIYTAALTNINFLTYSTELVNGGSDNITFAQLREKIINNSVGAQNLPITNVQLETLINTKGFDLVKNIDIITNRIFLAVQKLPPPINDSLIIPMNIGIMTYLDLELSLYNENDFDKIVHNKRSITILSENIFENKNSVLKILSNRDKRIIESKSNIEKIKDVNSHNYLYNPFYYVLTDEYNGFETRIYDLDSPTASKLNFKSQNETLKIPVNTSIYEIKKSNDVYILTLFIKSGDVYNNEFGTSTNHQVGAQITYIPENGSDYHYLEGVGETVETTAGIIDFIVYKFRIKINYEIFNNNLSIESRNSKGVLVYNEISLNKTVNILHYTNKLIDGYKPHNHDKYLVDVSDGSVPINAITHETLDINFGNELTNLWRRSRLLPEETSYKTYTENIPKVYTVPVYEVQNETGTVFKKDDISGTPEIVFPKLHSRGDNVLDSDGNQVYKHRVGDKVIGSNGSPIVSKIVREIDLLMFDAKYYFSTDVNIIDYRKEVKDIIKKWVLVDLDYIKDFLLEQTKIYFYPKDNIGSTKVIPSALTPTYINSEQKIVINIILVKNIYDDEDLRNDIIKTTKTTVRNHFDNNNINLTNLIIELDNIYSTSVISFDIESIDGKYRYLDIIDKYKGLSISKSLILRKDGELSVEDDIEVNLTTS